MMLAQLQRGDAIASLHTKITSSTIKEVSPNGLIIEHNLVGEATGLYSARHNETMTVFFKNDRTYEWNTKFTQTTKEGDFISGTGRGTGSMFGQNLHNEDGEIVFSTQSLRLSWLNNRKARFLSNGDMTNGESYATVIAL